MDTQPRWKELVILCLMWRAPIHGYEVKRLIALGEAIPSWATITHSDIYHTLERLESRGWATRGPSQGRHATPFSVTETGLRNLAEAIEFWLSSADHAYFMEFSIAIKFMDVLDDTRICAALRMRQQRLLDIAAWVEGRLATQETWPERFKGNPEGEESLLVFARGQLAWTEELLRRKGCSASV